MSIFTDKVYEEMDDISKLIEPYQYSLNDQLAQFPTEVEILPENIESIYSISTREIIRNKAKQLELFELADKVWDLSDELFQFKMIDDFGELTDSVAFNFQTKQILGKIFLVKTKNCLEDDDIVKTIKNTVDHSLNQWSNSYDSKRINELADLFNDVNVSKQRSIRKKMKQFRSHIVEMINSKKLDIRDVGLAKRFTSWVLAYIKDGNLAALSNLAKLKIMARQNKPIYSIDEKAIV